MPIPFNCFRLYLLKLCIYTDSGDKQKCAAILRIIVLYKMCFFDQSLCTVSLIKDAMRSHAFCASSFRYSEKASWVKPCWHSGKST